MSRRRRTFAEWQAAVNTYSQAQLGFCAFEADDPYDLMALATEQYALGTAPKAFLHEAFEEDFAAKAYDRHLRRESKRSAG
jgi:hypothetical protein